MTKQTEQTEETRLELSRHFEADPDIVFDAWTKKEIVEKWWGGKGYECTEVYIDLKVGGSYRMGLFHAESGASYNAYGKFIEIKKNSRLAMTWQWQEEGVKASETLLEIDFKASNGGTDLTLTQSKHVNREHMESHLHGWKGCLERIAKIIE